MITTSDIRTLPRAAATAAHEVARHEHAWVTESHHLTSEGVVLYVRCGSCRARRIDLQRRTDAPPIALTNPMG